MAKSKAQSSESFAKTAALDGMTEVEAGKIAVSKAKSADVKKFAQRMINDHEKANTELKDIAKAKGIALPTALDAEHQAMLDKLSAKSGNEFDAAYSKEMDMAHDKAVALFQAASTSSGVDKDLQSFAKRTLTTLQDHSRSAEQLSATHAAHAGHDGNGRTGM